MADGSGDRLAATLHVPDEPDSRPLAILVHGLTGCEDSTHVRRTARSLLSAGYPVIRLNLRGAGPSRPLCRGHYHAGRSKDMQAALVALERQREELLVGGVVPIGFSLGANMLTKFLAELDDDATVLAAVLVSAPIDLASAAARMALPRNHVYHRYLLTRMQEEALAAAAEVTEAERRAIKAAKKIIEFDDTFIAPRAGFADAADYYACCSGQRFLPHIACPTLVIHALDDPWIPPEPYLAFDWKTNPNLILLLSQTGGHVGFHGRGSEEVWHDRCILHFLNVLGT